MIMLEPDALQKSYATKLVHRLRQRSALEIISGNLVVLLSICYF